MTRRIIRAAGAATEMTADLDRWSGEGGAPAIEDRAARRPRRLAIGRQRFLLRLGVAVLQEWNGLPTGIRRTIFLRAAQGNGTVDKTEIARLLHQQLVSRGAAETAARA